MRNRLTKDLGAMVWALICAGLPPAQRCRHVAAAWPCLEAEAQRLLRVHGLPGTGTSDMVADALAEADRLAATYESASAACLTREFVHDRER